MDNVKTISQCTGEFLEEGSTEPGYQVNMDDAGAQAFIDKIKGVGGSPVSAGPITTAAPVEPAPEQKPVMSQPQPAVSKVTESSPPTQSKPVASKPGPGRPRK